MLGPLRSRVCASSAPARRRTMGVGHGAEALELEVRLDCGARAAGRGRALAVTTPDPAGGEPEALGGQVVVVQGFGRVQDFSSIDAPLTESVEHVLEVMCVGLVRADVLGG